LSLANRIDLTLLPFNGPVKSASGHFVTISGQTTLPIIAQGCYLPQDALVIDSSHANFAGLLGLGFVKKYRGNVLESDKVLELPHVRPVLKSQGEICSSENSETKGDSLIEVNTVSEVSDVVIIEKNNQILMDALFEHDKLRLPNPLTPLALFLTNR
jgi:hypothetical protein